MTNFKDKKVRRLKDDRSLLKMLLLSIVTLGIYEIWYMYHLITDVKYYFEDEDRPMPSFLKYFVFTTLSLGIYNIYYWLKVSDLMKCECQKNRINSDISAGFISICFILGYFSSGISNLVAFHSIFNTFNAIAENHNRRM